MVTPTDPTEAVADKLRTPAEGSAERAPVLSPPVSFGWPVVPRLELIYHFRYALIIPVCIGCALIGYSALTRALFGRERLPVA